MRVSTSTSLLLLASTAHGFTVPSATLPARGSALSSSPRLTYPLTVLSSSSVMEETTTATTEEPSSKSWTDDGFVFGLEGSGLERPKGKTAVTVVEGDTLDSQPYHIALVGGTFLGHAAFAATSIASMLQINNGNVLLTALQVILLSAGSWIFADFGSGVLHWSVDNYGNGRTPIMGGIIAAFQGHHSAPWTITERQFCNNVHKLCFPFGVVPMALISLLTGPYTTLFMTLFCCFEIGSQEFHKWSHMLKSQVPAWVNWLQDAGLTVARKGHAQHHLAPYQGNYAIVAGATNNLLDRSGFFRRLEHAVYKINGVEANSWKLDAALRERTLAGDYRLVHPNQAARQR